MKENKILLALLPFWMPLIPPMGISCLKNFLQPHGYRVKTVDANVEVEFKQIYDNYFNLLEKCIPENKKGNFYNLGSDVLQNHITAHLHYDSPEEKEYIELAKILIKENYFHTLEDFQVIQLNQIITDFYSRFETYLLNLLEEEKPGVFGLSVYKGTLGPSLFAFKTAKKKFPHIKTVMGGGIFSDHMALDSPNFRFFLKRTPYIDHIIVGEGEVLFLKWLKNEFDENKRLYTLADIKGDLLEISSAGIPDFSDFNQDHYSFLASYASRSCPYQCGFCAETVMWGKYRKKSAIQVVKELEQLYNTYGSQLFLMSDSLLNPIIDDLARAMLSMKLALYWDGHLRVDEGACDPGTAFFWRRGGFYRARLGVESGSQRVLDMMDKKITPTQIKKTLSSLASAGIKTTTFWVVGYPGETEADFQETLQLIEATRDNIYEAECNPFRYYWSGQVNSAKWMNENKPVLLYPESARDALILQTWIMDNVTPSREEIYSRVSRFVRHCDRLGIPNPYSWQDIYQADERWKKLQPNAVPSLMEFKEKGSYIDECKVIEKLVRVENIRESGGDFDF